MKILVTGGAGFIGANLIEHLLAEGQEVFCLDNFYSAKKENIAVFSNNSNFKFFEHDVIKNFPETLAEHQFDQIYHLACPASPPRYQKDHIYTLRTNFNGSNNVLEFAKKQFEKYKKWPKILFTSTSEIYGDPQVHPQNENYRGNTNPHGLRSCYDEGKRVAESLFMNYYRAFGVPVKIVRIFNTYGPKMDSEDGRVVSNFIMQALKNEPITVYGDGKQTRSFQYIDDLICGITKYMSLDEDLPGPINLGNAQEFSILELAEVIEKTTGKKLKINFFPLPADDPKTRQPDITLAKIKLNWEPKISLEEGIKKTIEYFAGLIEEKK